MIPTILLADDHIMTSKGLRRSLEYDFGYKEVCSVTSCNEVMKELKKKVYSHLVLDIGLSDGSALEILPTIRSLYPQLMILIFSAKPAAAYQRALTQYGIRYYLSKEANEDESMDRLTKFFRNEKSDLVEEAQTNPFSKLTAREMEILHYILEGLGVTKIASTLNLAATTISVVKGRIFEKTNTNNIKELMELAAIYKIS